MTAEQTAIIEQLRHACSVALGDLLAFGMPAQASTGRLLQTAIIAAQEQLLQAVTLDEAFTCLEARCDGSESAEQALSCVRATFKCLEIYRR